MPATELYRPNPLEGDSIMDATARLLAPRRGSSMTQRPTSVQKAGNPGKKNRNSKWDTVPEPSDSREPVNTEKTVPSHQHKKKVKGHKPTAHSEKKQIAPEQIKQEKRHVRSQKGPQEAIRSGHTKDSTEQKSLMKPYYLSF